MLWPKNLSISAAALLLLLSGCSKLNSYQDSNLASAQESSCGFVQNAKGYRVSWHSDVPMIFHFESSFPAQFRGAVKQAAFDWNQKTGKNLISVQDDDITSAASVEDQKNIIYWNKADGVFQSALEQGKTNLHWSDNNLTDADIIVNAKDWDFYIDTPPPGGGVHMESLLVHEFGHALGLVHQTGTGSVMYPNLKLDFVRVAPASTPDITDLDCEYL